MWLSPTKDLILILVIVLVIFGPKRLPGLGRQLGQGFREFRDSIGGDSDDPESEEAAQLPAASTESPAHNAPEAGGDGSQRAAAEVGGSEHRS